MARGLKSLYAEAKRRRVFRTSGVYLVAVWGISQGAAELAPLFGAPDWLVRAFVIGAIALLPVVVVLAWMFEIGRGGIVRDSEDLPTGGSTEPDIANMPTIAFGAPGARGVIIRWEDAGGAQARFFTDEVFFGRGNDCLMRFYDPLVSRRHARLFFDEGAWHLEDLGSRNGTTVNGEPAGGAALVGESRVRLNEEGPVLRIEVVDAGTWEDRDASGHRIERGVAHLRDIR